MPTLESQHRQASPKPLLIHRDLQAIQACGRMTLPAADLVSSDLDESRRESGNCLLEHSLNCSLYVSIPKIELFHEMQKYPGFLPKFARLDNALSNHRPRPDFRQCPASFFRAGHYPKDFSAQNKLNHYSIPDRWPMYIINEYFFYACICSKTNLELLNYDSFSRIISECSAQVGWNRFEVRNKSICSYTDDSDIRYLYPEFSNPYDLWEELIAVINSETSLSFKSLFVHLLWICHHPLLDGNGRVARALLNIILFSADIQSWIPFKMLFRTSNGEYLSNLRTAAVVGDITGLSCYFVSALETLLQNL